MSTPPPPPAGGSRGLRGWTSRPRRPLKHLNGIAAVAATAAVLVPGILVWDGAAVLLGFYPQLLGWARLVGVPLVLLGLAGLVADVLYLRRPTGVTRRRPGGSRLPRD
ncbi:MAG: hypothetical protein U0Q15_08780 [Kineosporiaceae bacterium]